MLPGSNPYATHTFQAPADGSLPDCHPLEICVGFDADGVPVRMSAWEPSEEEIAALQAGARVWLTTWGQRLPAASLSVGDRPPFDPDRAAL